ncbi:MAG: NAD(P)H-binding protein, partial [Sciscionella sp.]
SLDGALAGVETMYLFPPPGSAVGVLQRAVRAGVHRVVTLSSSSAADQRPGTENAIGRKHLEVEHAVEESGLAWTHVRPGAFAGNTISQWAESIKHEQLVRMPYPQAAKASAHNGDIAAVAAAALLDERHVGARYALTGPQSLTQAQEVAAIGEALGTEIRIEELSRDRARAEMTRWMPEFVADTLLDYLAEALDTPATVTTKVAEVLGRPARSFAQWARENVGSFR